MWRGRTFSPSDQAAPLAPVLLGVLGSVSDILGMFFGCCGSLCEDAIRLWRRSGCGVDELVKSRKRRGRYGRGGWENRQL